MRTIKKGKCPEEKEIIIRCRTCSTEFAFQQKEAKTEYDQREGGSIHRINCPLCGKECIGYS